MNVGVGPQSGVLERRFREMQSGEFATVSDVSHRLQWVVCSGLKLPARCRRMPRNGGLAGG